MKKNNHFINTILILIFFSFPSFADNENNKNDDFLEPINRPIWNFNYNVMDYYIYKPVSHTYVDYTSNEFRNTIRNILDNIKEPASVVNHLLEGEIKKSMINLSRFIVNSTFGIAGIFDLMEAAGVKKNHEDFGDVLGYYGVGEGSFLMIPFAGPSTIRVTVGDVVDSLYYSFINVDLYVKMIRWGLTGLDHRSRVINQEPLLEKSLDPYNFMKNAYLQYRLDKLYDGNIPQDIQEKLNEDDNLDNYLDEIE